MKNGHFISNSCYIIKHYKKSILVIVMAIPDDIQEYVEKNIKLMISQTETYLPIIKIVFPYSKNLADGIYNLIVGSAISVFINQYAMRMKYPTAEDFSEFAKIAYKYRDQIDQFFKYVLQPQDNSQQQVGLLQDALKVITIPFLQGTHW